MKRMKKLISFMLAAVMVLAMAIPAMAAGVTVKVTLPEDALLKGHRFTAYQIFTGTQTADPDDNKLASVEWASEINSSKFLDGLKELDADAFESCETAADVAEALSKITDTAILEKVAQLAYDSITDEAAGRELTKEVNELPAGYYVIVDTTEDIGEDGVRNAALLAATKNVTVQVKTDKPSLDKTITGETDPKYSNGAIGEAVNFQLKSKVPDMRHYVDYKFVVDDVMSKGLTFNNDVKVMIGDDDVTSKVVISTPNIPTDAGEEYADGTAIHIVFKDFFENYNNEKYRDKEIVITYTGTINKDAVIGAVGNPNEARLQYSNNPNEVGEGDDFDGTEPSGKTPWSETRTYVTAVELLKTGEDGTTPLPGAQFKITGTELKTTLVTGIEYVESATGKYWQLSDSEGNISYTDVDPDTQGLSQAAIDKYVNPSVKYEKKPINRKETTGEAVNATAEVGEDGILRIEGLAAGEYEITEIQAPNGYNLLSNPIKVTINWTAPSDTATDGQCTWAGTFDLQDGNDAKNLEFKNNIGALSFSVKNMQGSLLPSTGGIGTTIFYVLGGILVLGAGVLLIVKKRMSKLQ